MAAPTSFRDVLLSIHKARCMFGSEFILAMSASMNVDRAVATCRSRDAISNLAYLTREEIKSRRGKVAPVSACLSFPPPVIGAQQY